jgi:cysteine desulfurase/selenocysteine lyase
MQPDWTQLRALMPVAAKLAYLDHAAVAPLTAAARDALRQYADEAASEGDTVWPRWAARVEQVRQTAARLVNAENEEIAFVSNTTSGIHLVAEGFPWREGDNVVVPENEFPSNSFPWLNLADRGVETRRVPVEAMHEGANAASAGGVSIDRVLEACDHRTRLIAASWVGYASGWRLDVEQLVQRAHARGILVMLDAIQGMGVFPLDVRRVPVDFAAADGHKWMLGPEGAGLFYVRREHLDLLRPLQVGWNSVVQAYDFSHAQFRLRPSAARYEGGSQNMAGIAALGASLDVLAEYGLSSSESALAERILERASCPLDFPIATLCSCGGSVLRRGSS